MPSDWVEGIRDAVLDAPVPLFRSFGGGASRLSPVDIDGFAVGLVITRMRGKGKGRRRDRRKSGRLGEK